MRAVGDRGNNRARARGAVCCIFLSCLAVRALVCVRCLAVLLRSVVGTELSCVLDSISAAMFFFFDKREHTVSALSGWEAMDFPRLRRKHKHGAWEAASSVVDARRNA